MDFEDFEGFKRIKNIKKLNVEQLVSVLSAYKEILGEISYVIGLDYAKIYIDFKGRYGVEIKIDDKTSQIIIERKLDEGCIEDYDSNLENGKDLSEAKADRLIEQIYDLINDYMNNGKITEHITDVKKVIYMSEVERTLLKDQKLFGKVNIGGAISAGNMFEVKDENNQLLYQAKESPITKLYSLKNCITSRTDTTISYSNYKNQSYSIVSQPFENLVFIKDETTVKTRFIAKTTSKEYKISGDYTDNHYLIELNEIVIGAIDCLDPMVKTEYRLEINNIDEISKIVAIAIMLDTYIRKNEDIQYKKEIIENIKRKF